MKHLTSILMILLLGATVLTTGCGASPESAAAAPPEEAGGVPVEVAAIETGSIALILDYAGNLQAKKEVSVVPKVAGEIETVLVEVGDEIKKGDPLAIVDDDTYAVQLEQAEAAVSAARLNLEKMELGTRPEELAAAKSSLELARAALNDSKYIDDNERTSAAAALSNAQAALRQAQAAYDKIAWAGQVAEMPQALALEQATTGYEQALAAYNLQTNPSDSQLAPLELQAVQAELALVLKEEPFRPIDFEIARTNIQQAESALKLAQLQLDYTTLVAPFDGVVAELYIHEGSLVGQAPVALFVSNDMEVVVNVEESRLGQVAKGQHVSLQVSTHPGQEFPGVVTSVAPVADSKTHTFAVKVTPLDKEGLLHSGMYAGVSILAEEKQDTLLAPLAAITEVAGDPAVYVVNGDTVEQRRVTTGLATNTQVEILSGVKAGETVVVAGQPNLLDGVKVEVVPNL